MQKKNLLYLTDKEHNKLVEIAVVYVDF